MFIGAWIRIAYLPDPRHFKLFTGLALIYSFMCLLLDTVKKRDRLSIEEVPTGSFAVKMKTGFSLKRIDFEFAGETVSFSPASVLVLGFAVGIVGGIYGIVGGAIIAPVLVAFLAMPVYAVAGAALAGTFITSVAGLGFYQLLALRYTGQNVAPDWLLGLLFGSGGFVGMYLGARCQRYVPSRATEFLLCGCVLFAAVRYVVGFFSG